jgi:hypothetical protein
MDFICDSSHHLTENKHISPLNVISSPTSHWMLLPT